MVHTSNGTPLKHEKKQMSENMSESQLHYAK